VNWVFNITNENWAFDIANVNWVFDVANENWVFLILLAKTEILMLPMRIGFF